MKLGLPILGTVYRERGQPAARVRCSPLRLLAAVAVSQLSFLSICDANGEDESLTGEQIITNYIDAQKVDSELAFVKMTHVLPGPRVNEYRLLAVYRGNKEGGRAYFIRMIRPKDVESVSLLTVEDPEKRVKQYIYLPMVGKARELSDDNKTTPFLGTDYTFEDLLQEVPEHFRYKRGADGVVGGVECYVVRAHSKREESGSGYAYRDLFIAKAKSRVLKVDFYGDGDEKIKTFTAYEYESPDIKGKTVRPRRAVMHNDGAKTSTIFTVIEGRINEEIDPSIVTPEGIESWTEEEVDEFIFDYGFEVFADAEE